jgi:hypothetical protein
MDPLSAMQTLHPLSAMQGLLPDPSPTLTPTLTLPLSRAAKDSTCHNA